MRRAWFVFCSLMLAGDAFGQARLSWEVQEDFGGLTAGRGITLSDGGAIVVANGSSTVGGLVVQAVGRSDGNVKWTDQSGSLSFTQAVITSFRDSVYAAGLLARPPQSVDILVRALDASTGTLLWSNVWAPGGGSQPEGIAATSTAVIVVGYGGGIGPEPEHFIVRAYDRKTGAVLWEDRADPGPNGSQAWAVATTETQAFVAGTILTTSSTGAISRDLILRAYNIASGQKEWEFDRASTSPVALKSFAGQVLLVGSTSAAGHPYIAAFNQPTGTLAWDDEAPVPGILEGVAAHANRIVAVGRAGQELLVQAYDAQTGVFTWRDQPPLLPGFGQSGTAVAINDTGVFVSGLSEEDFVYSEILVRAYAPMDGTLLWDDRSHRGTFSTAIDLALGPGRLFVVGDTDESPGDTDLVIRAYDIRNQSVQTKLEGTSPNEGLPSTSSARH